MPVVTTSENVEVVRAAGELNLAISVALGAGFVSMIVGGARPPRRTASGRSDRKPTPADVRRAASCRTRCYTRSGRHSGLAGYAVLPAGPAGELGRL
jgi:hypothetical protein